jgi:AraC-like DNA-binding protein
MNRAPLKTPNSWAKAIIDTLIAKQIDVMPIVKALNIELDRLSDRSGMIEQDSVSALWEAAVDATGDQNIGFEVGRNILTLLSPVIAYSLMSCSNLKESCDRLLRYQDIVAEGLQFEIRESESEYQLLFDILPSTQAPSSQAIKSAIAAFFAFVRWVTQTHVCPTKATLKEPQPQDLAVYETLFSCPISFDAVENCLSFSRAELLKPLPTADAHLSELHEQQLQSYREKQYQPIFSDAVKRCFKDHLPTGEPHQEVIASQLNVSVTTLKRRLKEEDLTYNTLLDSTRHELALKYLAQRKLSFTEITYLLGFSQSSAFTRAFKRWQGESPSEYLTKLNA